MVIHMIADAGIVYAKDKVLEELHGLNSMGGGNEQMFCVGSMEFNNTFCTLFLFPLQRQIYIKK